MKKGRTIIFSFFILSSLSSIVMVDAQLAGMIGLSQTEYSASEGDRLEICVKFATKNLPTNKSVTISLHYNNSFVDSAPVTIPMGQLRSGQVCNVFEILPNEGNPINVSLITVSPLFLRDDRAGSAVILLKRAPTLRIASPEVVVRQFEAIEILCTPSQPNISVTWTRAGVNISAFSRRNGRFILSPPGMDHRLKIERVNSEDAGTYTCQVSERPEVRANVTITVLLPACPAEVDELFDLAWEETVAGEIAELICDQDQQGSATRVCGSDGSWLATDFRDCLGTVLTQAREISELVSRLLREGAPYDPAVANILLNLVSILASATSQDLSKMPRELESVADFISLTVDYLSTGAENTSLEELGEQFESVLIVMSNLVSPSNLPGVMDLVETNPEATFSLDLLDSAEKYGLYLSTLIDQSNTTQDVTQIADNIFVNVRSINVSDGLQDLIFPSDEDKAQLLANENASSLSILSRLSEARIVIPASVLRERAAARNSGTVRVANILFQNIEMFLPANFNGSHRDPVTLVLSSQVEKQRAVQALVDPVTISFTATNQTSNQSFSCAFFDFDLGEFSTEGVTTKTLIAQGNNTIIECASDHLTSFAVLVNVAGVDLTGVALSAVSYIGLGISLVFLLATILFYLSFGKQLFLKGVHNLVHLNLAIALFLAYLLFAVGVELAAKNLVACQVVAAALHYLFLAVFCWMLSEGVMLYLMLVVVFSTLAKKWWFFMILGWVPPIPFVVIGLTSVLDQYGVYTDGQLTYCWLASGSGQYAIWTFVAPMLAVILINVVFLVFVLFSLVRSQHKKLKNGLRIKLVWSIVKASVILLPLLGMTWVFGLLVVNRTAIAFAWIFTILNSFQGTFIFILHVLRHDKVWGTIKKKYNILQTTTSKQMSKIFSNPSTGSTSGSISSRKLSDLESSYNQEDSNTLKIQRRDFEEEIHEGIADDNNRIFQLVKNNGGSIGTSQVDDATIFCNSYTMVIS